MRIKNAKEFDHLLVRLNHLARINLRLPAKVFCDQLRFVSFFEFDLFSGDKFWNLICRLAKENRDERITLSVLDPDPVEYFFKEFDEYGAFELTRDDSGDVYFEELSAHPNRSSADSLLHNSEVLVWLGTSERWLIWGERSNGVAILATEDNIHIEALAKDAGLAVFDASAALRQLVSPNFRGGQIPKEWESEFRLNFS